ncbi:3-dehydroquinate synthase [bioreactor metagenome]|uniref:3-dehydroquinate synthase n=1 Tax=bioreactor metagenome TaxID=1076179 RepID=A0A645CS73_9ZZZZ|nr:3-dehydroquinate synthase [Christensenella sp.]
MEHRVIPVCVREGYNVVIGGGLLRESGPLIRAALGERRIAVVTDSHVEKIYLAPLMESLTQAGYDASPFVFSAGEQNKRMHTVADMLEFFAAVGLTRKDCVLALGGGVTGDMAGFAAGCYLRGIDYVQLPTTLLAAVDSSVGGKTAVDLSAGKNLAGLFHQPSMVLCDTECFATLPPDEFANGAAEAIKTGILDDESLFSLFESGDVLRNIGEIVAQCAAFKAHVVEEDERETGLRKTLNLGHTAGHAIELCSGYTIPHGHAVAIGLAIISRAAERLGWAEEPVAARITRTLRQNGLPTTTEFSPEELANAALLDKKRAGGTLTLVVPRRIGSCDLMDVAVERLPEIFRAGMEADA